MVVIAVASQPDAAQMSTIACTVRRQPRKVKGATTSQQPRSAKT